MPCPARSSQTDAIVVRVRETLRRSEGPVLVALDGRSGVGKSTIASGLVEQLGGALISGDDFYAGGTDAEWTARSPEQRRARVFDWHRLRVDALDPLLAGRVAAWRSFNWQTWEGLSDDLIVCDPAPVIVLDMVYSCGPELSDLVDLSVLVALDDEERRARLATRDGAEHRDRWLALWESAENHYFTHIRRPDSFDLVVAR